MTATPRNDTQIPHPRSSADESSPKPKQAKHLPFAQIAVEVVRNPAISDSARLLYVIMATYADTQGRDGFAGRRRLAQDMGKSMGTVTRLLRELEAAGVVTRSARFETVKASGKQRRTTDEWRLLDEKQTSKAARNAAAEDTLDALRMANTGRLADGRDPFAPSAGDYM
ncbi:helix-turn-helix domain-containing protein [Micromonospora tulbaghiae]|uniref:helix-turn-helix domain-containing protein n=1 Tax=Micromonospora tulbaghiae TaxID=479978 RepID=UPI0033FAAA7F